MITGLCLSLFGNVLFLSLAIYFVCMLNRAGHQINQYEAFYQQTIEALEKHLTYMQNLLNANVALSGDDGVVQVFKTIKTFYEMLIQYANAAKTGDAAQK